MYWNKLKRSFVGVRLTFYKSKWLMSSFIRSLYLAGSHRFAPFVRVTVFIRDAFRSCFVRFSLPLIFVYALTCAASRLSKFNVPWNGIGISLVLVSLSLLLSSFSRSSSIFLLAHTQLTHIHTHTHEPLGREMCVCSFAESTRKRCGGGGGGSLHIHRLRFDDFLFRFSV